jgi:hypothetical protein
VRYSGVGRKGPIGDLRRGRPVRELGPIEAECFAPPEAVLVSPLRALLTGTIQQSFGAKMPDKACRLCLAKGREVLRSARSDSNTVRV